MVLLHIWWTVFDLLPFYTHILPVFCLKPKDSDTKYNELCLPCCRRSFLSHRRNAGWRLRGAGGQPPCHRLPERFLLYVDVPPFPVPVGTARRAQGHLWRPPHLLPLCDLWPALHLPSVDHWAECECLTGRRRKVFVLFVSAVMGKTDVDSALFSCRSPAQSGTA